MTRRRGTAGLAASPVLVGAVTVLVSIIAVFIAYNANAGLPFVPTYDLRAEIPGGSNLVEGNEVRMDGFRVGVVEKIRPAVSEEAEQRAIALLELSLDKLVEELPADTRLAIRPRSALGLKYVELTPGRSRETLRAGATLPLRQSLKPIELDEFFSTFDDEMRSNQRTALEGFGTALAGRGEAINRAIEALVPFVTRLEPVMRNLSDPDTELDQFFRQAGRTSAQIAPVARTYAALFGNMATTFEALSRHRERLRGAIERLRPTLDEGVRSFPVQRPFLRDSAELARRLEPVAEEFERSLPPTADALDVGAPVLRKAPPFYQRTRNLFEAVDELTSNPNTLLALKDLHRTLEVATPLVEWVAPYQTVCNYWVYYFSGLSEHVSEPVRGGTVQRTQSKTANNTQDNRVNQTDADRPADIRANASVDEKAPDNSDLQALHNGAYWPSVDAQGNADCMQGQRGYLDGPLVPGGRYPPSNDVPEQGTDTVGGGSHVVLESDFPGRAGGTFKANELGIDNVRDVP